MCNQKRIVKGKGDVTSDGVTEGNVKEKTHTHKKERSRKIIVIKAQGLDL